MLFVGAAHARTRIGSSPGVRLPVASLVTYVFGEAKDLPDYDIDGALRLVAASKEPFGTNGKPSRIVALTRLVEMHSMPRLPNDIGVCTEGHKAC